MNPDDTIHQDTRDAIVRQLEAIRETLKAEGVPEGAELCGCVALALLVAQERTRLCPEMRAGFRAQVEAMDADEQYD